MRKQYEQDYDGELYEESSSGSSGGIGDKLTYLLVGGGIGAVLALLFAPKSGNELRGDISDATRKGYGRTREAAQQLKQKSGRYYGEARQVAGNVYSRAGDAYAAARSELSRAANQRGETASGLVDDPINQLASPTPTPLETDATRGTQTNRTA